MRIRKMVCGAGVLIAALPLVAGPASAELPRASASTQAEPPDGWFNLPYFQSGYGWFRVVTNSQTFGGVRINGTQPLTSPYPGPTAEENSGKTLEALWATKCQKKKDQTVTFERKVFLPGVPDKLQASLFAMLNSSYSKQPIKSIALKVNGTTILQVGKGGGGAVPDYTARTLVDLDSYGSEFKYGENTITIVATKKETKKPHPVAGPYCVGDNIFGAAAELYGEFTADVATTGPTSGGTTQATSTGVVIPITITNNGPTDLFAGAGQFSFAASSNQATVTHVIAGVDNGGNAVIQNCSNDLSYSDGRGDGMQAICPLPRLAPGESLSFNALVGFEGLDCPDDKIWFYFNSPGYFESEATTGNNGSTERGISRSGC